MITLTIQHSCYSFIQSWGQDRAAVHGCWCIRNQSIKSQPEAQAQQIITFVNNLDHFLILAIRSTAREGVNSVYTVHSSYLSKLFKNENDNTSESCSFASPSGKLSISKYRGHDHTTHSFLTGVQVLIKNKLIDVLDVSFYSKKSELKMLKYL